MMPEAMNDEAKNSGRIPTIIAQYMPEEPRAGRLQCCSMAAHLCLGTESCAMCVATSLPRRAPLLHPVLPACLTLGHVSQRPAQPDNSSVHDFALLTEPLRTPVNRFLNSPVSPLAECSAAEEATKVQGTRESAALMYQSEEHTFCVEDGARGDAALLRCGATTAGGGKGVPDGCRAAAPPENAGRFVVTSVAACGMPARAGSVVTVGRGLTRCGMVVTIGRRSARSTRSGSGASPRGGCAGRAGGSFSGLRPALARAAAMARHSSAKLATAACAFSALLIGAPAATALACAAKVAASGAGSGAR